MQARKHHKQPILKKGLRCGHGRLTSCVATICFSQETIEVEHSRQVWLQREVCMRCCLNTYEQKVAIAFSKWRCLKVGCHRKGRYFLHIEIVFPQRYSFPRINTLRLYTYQAPVKMLFLSYGTKYWAECCNGAFNLWDFGCQISELHHLILLDIWAKMYCNYRMNSWVMAINVFCEVIVTLTLDLKQPHLNQFILESYLTYAPNLKKSLQGVLEISR